MSNDYIHFYTTSDFSNFIFEVVRINGQTVLMVNNGDVRRKATLEEIEYYRQFIQSLTFKDITEV